MRVDATDVLNRPFDPETHKATFINYFETVMTGDGTVIYANPSHVRVLERLYTARYACEPTYDEYRRWLVGHRTVLDYLEWLMETTDAIALWTHGFLGVPNEAQVRKIDELIGHGIMKVGER